MVIQGAEKAVFAVKAQLQPEVGVFLLDMPPQAGKGIADPVPGQAEADQARDVARRRPGILFGIGLIGIFLTRFFIEFIKTEQEAFEQGWLLDMGQWLSIPFILLGIYMIYRGATQPEVVPVVPKSPAATAKKKKK